MEKKWPLMNTILGTHERAIAEGLGISKNMIRNLVLSGELSSVIVGKNTRLIHWDNLLNHLYNGSLVKPTMIDNQTIKRIEVK